MISPPDIRNLFDKQYHQGMLFYYYHTPYKSFTANTLDELQILVNEECNRINKEEFTKELLNIIKE